MLSVYGAQFLNATFLFALFVFEGATPVFVTVIVPATSTYVTLLSHKLICHIPSASSFIATQFLVLNLNG